MQKFNVETMVMFNSSGHNWF